MIDNALWRKTLLSPDASIRDAIELLIDSSLRIALITDSSGRLVGTITDGDIRRGLLKGLSISSQIAEIVNTKPIVVPQSFSRESVLKIMSANKIYQVPVIDDDSKLVGLHLWDEIQTPSFRKNAIVIMAGGRGTRLLPKTANTPKPMLPIGGKPILEHIISRAKSQGFTHFYLAIHYLGNVIEEYFGDGSSLGVKIEYIKESSPLGTAGALSLIEPSPGEAIVVTNGDVLTDIDFGDLLDFHLQNEAKGTMAVQVYEWQNPYGVIRTNGIEITNYEEKPKYNFLINAGVYVLEPNCLDLLEKGEEAHLPSLFELMGSKGLKTVAFLIHEQWTDIGGHEEFAKASNNQKRWG
jgi:dTDP-glucose pyrophosphorylase